VDGVGHRDFALGSPVVPRVVIAALLLVLLAPATASATAIGATARTEVRPGPRPGVERLHYEFGPIHIAPGQNTIEFQGNELKPDVPGWIVGFKPDLIYKDGTVPRVDVIHLHHGVWVSNFQPLFAAGEEKTIVKAPEGYGWPYKPSDDWIMNHMIHNLTPSPTDVYITYDLDFIPAGSPAAAGIKDVRTVWLDVTGYQIYPVFDVHKGAGGKDRRFTYPDEARGLGAGYRKNTWTATEDGVLVGTAGHLHPGGLWTDLELTRDGRTVHLFRSRAKYFEPAGAVSWDVAMTATPSSWRVGIRKGDVLSVSATYDTRRSSWYESMGIMQVAFNPAGAGPDPFVTAPATEGEVTHGHLPENRNHGGAFGGLPDARRLLAAPPARSRVVPVRGFVYGQGDLGLTGRRGRPPTIRPGQTLKFVNRDAKGNIFHTITSCKAPCTGRTGIAFPLANGPLRFDSGNLGFGPAGATPAAQRITWRTPRTIKPGTYTYFCRVHPFMRGAFRVAKRH
jgi:plastocyanin